MVAAEGAEGAGAHRAVRLQHPTQPTPPPSCRATSASSSSRAQRHAVRPATERFPTRTTPPRSSRSHPPTPQQRHPQPERLPRPGATFTQADVNQRRLTTSTTTDRPPATRSADHRRPHRGRGEHRFNITITPSPRPGGVLYATPRPARRGLRPEQPLHHRPPHRRRDPRRPHRFNNVSGSRSSTRPPRRTAIADHDSRSSRACPPGPSFGVPHPNQQPTPAPARSSARSRQLQRALRRFPDLAYYSGTTPSSPSPNQNPASGYLIRQSNHRAGTIVAAPACRAGQRAELDPATGTLIADDERQPGDARQPERHQAPADILLNARCTRWTGHRTADAHRRQHGGSSTNPPPWTSTPARRAVRRVRHPRDGRPARLSASSRSTRTTGDGTRHRPDRGRIARWQARPAAGAPRAEIRVESTAGR